MIRFLCLITLLAACSKQPAVATTPPPAPVAAVMPAGESVGVLARVKMLPGKEEALFALLRETAAAVQETEPDTRAYLFFRNTKDPQELIIFEVYTTKGALDAHNQSAAMTAMRPKLPALVDVSTLKIEVTDTAVLGFLR
ncbi:MAG: putative quinol monooxygenase [Kofleriaceae bacterium]